MTTDLVLQLKLDAIRSGRPARVLDLFSGCGGLSLGFSSAGCTIVGGLELDPLAARTHAMNFHGTGDAAHVDAHANPRDIALTAPADIAREWRWESPLEAAVDIIVGGPPCQAYARVGRAKLREVADHPDAFKVDDRGHLYLRYLRYVRELRPLAVLLENVPDSLNYGGHNVAEEFSEVLEDLGYDCAYTLLNAAFYGVPQMRERMFLIGISRLAASDIRFPAPTNWLDLPAGYEGSRQVAMKVLGQAPLFGSGGHFRPPPKASRDLPPAVTAREALGDLPRIDQHLNGELRRGARRLNEFESYPDARPPTDYARLMREWPGFESPAGIWDHAIRSLPRDYAIFRRMRPGDQYPEAYKHAVELFEEQVTKHNANGGSPITPGSSEFERLRSSIVPPYDTQKFPNKWRKMEPDRPSRTLMAHLGKDSYSHIHYDSAQARTISVREAARLQSFPDGFRFQGTMNPALKQIGNAVPPLLAWRLAETITSSILDGRS